MTYAPTLGYSIEMYVFFNIDKHGRQGVPDGDRDCTSTKQCWYEGNFYGSNNDINANGFNARGGGYTSSYGDFSTNINGKFYGNEISSVGGNINITDSLNTLEGTFSANKQ